MANDNDVSKDILAIEKAYFDEKKITHSINEKYLERIYALKRKYINDSKNYELLTHLEEYIKFKNTMLNSAKNTLMALITFVFLPLSFITGFFGMNFLSMGNPGIKRGILKMPYSDFIIIMVSIGAILTTVIYFYDTYHTL